MRSLRYLARGILAVLLFAVALPASAGAAAGISSLPDTATEQKAAAAPLNFQGLWWRKPAGTESGWGINFTHQGDIIFATWFTYDAAGKPWWLIAELHGSGNNVFTGPVSTVKGVPFNAQPWDTTRMVETIVGTMTATFADAKNGTLSYTVNGITQVKDITQQEFGTLPDCVYGAAPASLAAAINFQDLWWAKPAGSESGWGINLTHQDHIIFATWFTYDADGKPWWLIAELHRSAARVYGGPVSTVKGVPFDASPWDTTKIVETQVGTMQITFADGNNAVIDYTVNGIHQTKNATRQVFGTLGTVCTPPDTSAAFVAQLVDLAGRANRGEITSEAFVAQYRAILEAIDDRGGGIEQLQQYLEANVLGHAMPAPKAGGLGGDRVGVKALAPGDFDLIDVSPAHQLLQAALESTVFRQTPDGAGNQVVAANVQVDIALSGIVVRVAVLDAATGGAIVAGTANQLLTLIGTNPFAAYKQLLQALGQPIPGWLANAPTCLTGCGPTALRYGGPMSGSALLTVTYGPLSCTANVSFSGTVTLDMTVSGVTIVSGTAAVDGTATVSNSNNPGLCPNGAYALSGSAPLTGTVSNMTAALIFGGKYPGTLNASLAGNTITGTISTVLIPGSPALVANFTLTQL